MARHSIDRGDETISLSRQGFNVACTARNVAKYAAEPVDGGVQVAIRIGGRPLRPEQMLEFLSGNNFTGAIEQGGQDLKWLSREVKANPVLAQFAGLGIDLEAAEAQQGRVGRDGGGVRR